jgi:hypothetical protein
MNIRLEIRSVANGISHAVWLVNTETNQQELLNAEANCSRGPNAGKSKQHMIDWASKVAKVISPDCAVIS